MNKKMARILILIALVVCIVFSACTPVFASISADKIYSDGKAWMSQGQSQNKISANQVADVLKPVANILLAIGSVLVVIVAVIIGIKYVTSTPDQKGHLKKQLIGLVVSAVVLYGAYGIWSIVYSILLQTIG